MTDRHDISDVLPDGWEARVITPGPEAEEVAGTLHGKGELDTSTPNLFLRHEDPTSPGDWVYVVVPVHALQHEAAIPQFLEAIDEMVEEGKMPAALQAEARQIIVQAGEVTRTKTAEREAIVKRYIGDLQRAILNQVALAGGMPAWSSSSGWQAYLVEGLDDRSKVAMLRIQPHLPDGALNGMWILFANPTHTHADPCGAAVPFIEGDLAEAIDYYRAYTQHMRDTGAPACALDANAALVEYLEYLTSEAGSH